MRKRLVSSLSRLNMFGAGFREISSTKLVPRLGLASMAKRKLKVRKSPSVPDETTHEGVHSDLDVFAHGSLREILQRFRSSLLQEAAKTAVDRRIDANDLERAYQRLLRPIGPGKWQVLNRRRIYLIQKQLADDISPEEVDELRDLQDCADRRMSDVAPRPLEMLWDLKRQLMGS